MLFTDLKFASILGPRLVNFKQKKSYLWNFACPICSDATDKKRRTRAYIYRPPSGDYLAVKCHHCGYSSSLQTFLKSQDSFLYKQYLTEKFQESVFGSKETAPVVEEKEELLVDGATDALLRVDMLPEDHPAYQYLLGRKIPEDKFELFYHTDTFKAYTNSVKPGKFTKVDGELKDDHPRLIIPYFDKHGKLFAFQGRAYDDREPKYFMIKMDESEEKIYGMDRVDYSKKIYVTEGPIDSIFIPNAIAVSGSSFDTLVMKRLKSNVVIVFDNEPRAKEITRLMKNCIDAGYTVYIPPDNLEAKDINDLVLAGYTQDQIKSMIDSNTYRGPSAILRYNYWRKRD